MPKIDFLGKDPTAVAANFNALKDIPKFDSPRYNEVRGAAKVAAAPAGAAAAAAPPPKPIIYYDPKIYGNDPVVAQKRAMATLGASSTRGNEGPSKDAFKEGVNAKHRMISGEVEFKATERGPIHGDGFKAIVSTICAPNGMLKKNHKNPSCPEDVEFFFKNGEVDVDKYKAAMKLEYARVLKAQIDAGVQVVVMPPVGMGLFINTLKSDEERQKAIKANYGAMQEAIKELTDEEKQKLQGVVLCGPQAAKDDIAKNAFAGHLAPPAVGISQGGLLDTAQAVEAAGMKVGIINAGHHNDLGGGYEKILNSDKKIDSMPVEEFLMLASMRGHPSLEDQIVRQGDKLDEKYEFRPFPEALQCPDNLKQLPPAATSIQESVDVLAAFKTTVEKKAKIQAALLQVAGNPALKNHDVKLGDVTVTPTNDSTWTITVKATFKGKDSAPEEVKDLTLTRTVDKDGNVKLTCTAKENLSSEQRFAISAAYFYQQRVEAAAPNEPNKHIQLSIENPKNLPVQKNGLTADEEKLVKAALAAGFTKVYCRKDNKPFTSADFGPAAVREH